MGHRELGLTERRTIEGLLHRKLPIRQIAEVSGRHGSSVWIVRLISTRARTEHPDQGPERRSHLWHRCPPWCEAQRCQRTRRQSGSLKGQSGWAVRARAPLRYASPLVRNRKKPRSPHPGRAAAEAGQLSAEHHLASQVRTFAVGCSELYSTKRPHLSLNYRHPGAEVVWWASSFGTASPTTPAIAARPVTRQDCSRPTRVR